MKVVAKNKKAYFNYEILDRFEAGIMLTGTEVKSLRAGRVQLKDSFVIEKGDNLWLVNAHIAQYEPATRYNHDPERRRKLLLHKHEIRRLTKKLKEQGLTIVPLLVYFTDRSIAKVELGLARGKRKFDKRQQIKKRDMEREMRRDLANRRRK